MVKVNGFEAADLLGWPGIQDVPAAHQAAKTIQQSGISQVVLTLGKLGAVLASEAGVWFAYPPEIKAVCTIGSGDAFLGGLVFSWIHHVADPDGLRRAVAAGSANTLSVGGGKFSHLEFEDVLAKTTLVKLA